MPFAADALPSLPPERREALPPLHMHMAHAQCTPPASHCQGSSRRLHSCLLVACDQDNLECSQLLIDAKAAVDLADHKALTPLYKSLRQRLCRLHAATAPCERCRRPGKQQQPSSATIHSSADCQLEWSSGMRAATARREHCHCPGDPVRQYPSRSTCNTE